MNSGRSIIQASQVDKTVASGDERLEILSDINLNITSGEAVAIVGPSGSGKTTLLSLIAGLDFPTRGTITLAGKNLAQLTESQRAALRQKNVGFIFQSFQLIPTLSALENVMLPIELAKTPQPDVLAKKWLDRVGLSHRLRHYPNQLSGGEQQRVAIARAFAVSPHCLFADEPTGNLDKASAAKITDLLFELNQEEHTTLLIVTHDEHLARRCHRQLTLDGGRLC